MGGIGFSVQFLVVMTTIQSRNCGLFGISRRGYLRDADVGKKRGWEESVFNVRVTFSYTGYFAYTNTSSLTTHEHQ
jgi:hypothetical protein